MRRRKKLINLLEIRGHVILFLHLAACRLSLFLFSFDSSNRHTNVPGSISMPYMVKTVVRDTVFSFLIGIPDFPQIDKKIQDQLCIY